MKPKPFLVISTTPQKRRVSLLRNKIARQVYTRGCSAGKGSVVEVGWGGWGGGGFVLAVLQVNKICFGFQMSLSHTDLTHT